MTPQACSDGGHLQRYLGRPVRAPGGERLGTVRDVLADARSGTAQWLVLRVHTLGLRYRAVPIGLSVEVAHGLVVPTSRRAVLRGPRLRLGRSLPARQERALRAHWAVH